MTRRTCGLIAAAMLLSTTVQNAAEIRLDRRAVDAAVSIGQSRVEAQRARFHTPYRLIVSRSPIDYVEVVTPFRRVVLAAQAQAALGDRSFGQRQALQVASSTEIELLVELTFHPHHTYVGVPDYAVTLARESAPNQRLLPRAIDRLPRHGPRLEGVPVPIPAPVMPGNTQPMVGGMFIARFDGSMIDGTENYLVVIAEGGKELARARLPLATLR